MINQRANEMIMRKYRKELQAMLGDVAKIDAKVLNKAVLAGIRKIKISTPVDTGHLQRSWHFTSPRSSSNGVESTIYNNVEYAMPVNYGHRVKNKEGKTVGFIKGKFMLEKAMAEVDKALVLEFEKAVKEVKRKHGS